MNINVESLLIFSCLTFLKALPPGTYLSNPSANPRYIPVLGQMYGSGKTTVSKYFLDMCNLIFKYLGLDKFYLVISYLRKVIINTNSKHSIKFSIKEFNSWIQLLLKNSLESLENDKLHQSMKSISIDYDLNKYEELKNAILKLLIYGKSYYYIVPGKNVQYRDKIFDILIKLKELKALNQNLEPIFIIDELPDCIDQDNFIKDFNDFRQNIGQVPYNQIHLIFVGRGLHSISNFSQKKTNWGHHLYSINIQPFEYPQVYFLFKHTELNEKEEQKIIFSKLNENQKKLFVKNTLRLTSGIPLFVNFALNYKFKNKLKNYMEENHFILDNLDFSQFKDLISINDTIYERSKIDLFSNLELFPIFIKTLLMNLCSNYISIDFNIGNYLLNDLPLKNYLLINNKINHIRMDSIMSLFPTYISSKNSKVKIIIPPLAHIDIIETRNLNQKYKQLYENTKKHLDDNELNQLNHEHYQFIDTIKPSKKYLNYFNKKQKVLENEELKKNEFDSNINSIVDMTIYPLYLYSIIKMSNNIQIFKAAKYSDDLETMNRYLFASFLAFNDDLGFIDKFIKKMDQTNHRLFNFNTIKTPDDIYFWDNETGRVRNFNNSKKIYQYLYPITRYPLNINRPILENYLCQTRISDILKKNKTPNHPSNFAFNCYETLFEISENVLNNSSSYPRVTPCVIVEPLYNNFSADSIFLYAILNDDNHATLIVISIQDKFKKNSNDDTISLMNSEYPKTCMFISEKKFLETKFKREIELYHFFFVIKPSSVINDDKKFSCDRRSDFPNTSFKNMNIDKYIEYIKNDDKYKIDHVNEYLFFIDMDNIDILYGKGFKNTIHKLYNSDNSKKDELYRLSILTSIFEGNFEIEIKNQCEFVGNIEIVKRKRDEIDFKKEKKQRFE